MDGTCLQALCAVAEFPLIEGGGVAGERTVEDCGEFILGPHHLGCLDFHRARQEAVGFREGMREHLHSLGLSTAVLADCHDADRALCEIARKPQVEWRLIRLEVGILVLDVIAGIAVAIGIRRNVEVE